MSEGVPPLKVSKQSAEILKEAISTYGAGVWGRRTFDIAHAWGGNPPGSPAFIVTHDIPQEWVYEGSPFTFVTDGVESAIRQAQQAAGDKDVVVCTASILQQCLNLGLMDEIHIDVAPLLLGKGVRLFDHLDIKPIELERIRVVGAPGVTHLGFRVVNYPRTELVAFIRSNTYKKSMERRVSMRTVTSKDGTTIAFDQSGKGPAVILVTGALGTRSHATPNSMADILSKQFTAIDYDRRGRGDSGNNPPYAGHREKLGR